MTESTRRAWLVLPLCALLYGCGGTSEPLEQTLEQTHRIDPDARISITNGDGSIDIYGWEKPKLYVQATKKAYTAARLNGIVVNIAAQPNSVSITTIFPPNKTWGLSDRSGTVDYLVVVPAAARLSRLELKNGQILVTGMEGGQVHATLGRGRVFSRNCFADTYFQVNTGVLTLDYDWWEQRKFSVEATIKNGNVSTAMPGDASFHLVAKSPNGRITNDFAQQEQRRESASRETDMVTGNGPAAEVKIHAQNGNIQVVEANP